MTDASAPMTLRAGFVGLGAMGVGMANNLHKRGLLTAVWNRTRSRAVALANETGARASTSLGELAGLVDVIVVCVSADEDVLGIVDELIKTELGGKIVIDCSTVSADTARAAAHRL